MSSVSVRAPGGIDHVRRDSLPGDDERLGGSAEAEDGAYLDIRQEGLTPQLRGSHESIRAVLSQYNDSCKSATAAGYDEERLVDDDTTSDMGH